jgi:hypothetical protein
LARSVRRAAAAAADIRVDNRPDKEGPVIRHQINRRHVAAIAAIALALLGIFGVQNPQAIVGALTTITCAVAECVDDAPASVTAP